MACCEVYYRVEVSSALLGRALFDCKSSLFFRTILLFLRHMHVTMKRRVRISRTKKTIKRNMCSILVNV